MVGSDTTGVDDSSVLSESSSTVDSRDNSLTRETSESQTSIIETCVASTYMGHQKEYHPHSVLAPTIH